VVSKYGNMMRVWDCPLDGAKNRVQSLNLRLVSGACAVHADMVTWHESDTPENVAQQLFGTMFSVPQISVRMENLSEIHGKVLRNYLDFWNAHRYTLMQNRVRMTLCENGYGMAWVETEQEKIVMLAHRSVLEFDGRAAELYAVNLTDKESLIVKNTAGVPIRLAIYDCMGETIETDVLLTDSLHAVAAPTGALLVLKGDC
jgi:alpha-galactosidase